MDVFWSTNNRGEFDARVTPQKTVSRAVVKPSSPHIDLQVQHFVSCFEPTWRFSLFGTGYTPKKSILHTLPSVTLCLATPRLGKPTIATMIPPSQPHLSRTLFFVITLLFTNNTHGFTTPLLLHPDPIHAAASSMPDLLTAYKAQLTAHPLTTKMLTGASLAVCGDAIAQQRDDDDYDVTRAASFGVFDMAYRALQHVSFPILVQQCQGQFLGGLSTLLLASSALSDHAIQHAAASMEQTLGSQLIIVPFLYYPAFFTLTGSMQGLDGRGIVQRARENFVPLMQRNLLFWIPVQFVQFGFVPTDLQIPFLSCAGLAWTFILSVAAGSAKQYSNSSNNNKDASQPPEPIVMVPENSQHVEIQGIPSNGTMAERQIAEVS